MTAIAEARRMAGHSSMQLQLNGIDEVINNIKSDIDQVPDSPALGQVDTFLRENIPLRDGETITEWYLTKDANGNTVFAVKIADENSMERWVTATPAEGTIPDSFLVLLDTKVIATEQFATMQGESYANNIEGNPLLEHLSLMREHFGGSKIKIPAINSFEDFQSFMLDLGFTINENGEWNPTNPAIQAYLWFHGGLRDGLMTQIEALRATGIDVFMDVADRLESSVEVRDLAFEPYKPTTKVPTSGLNTLVASVEDYYSDALNIDPQKLNQMIGMITGGGSFFQFFQTHTPRVDSPILGRMQENLPGGHDQV